jgi:hypothetical protein
VDIQRSDSFYKTNSKHFSEEPSQDNSGHQVDSILIAHRPHCPVVFPVGRPAGAENASLRPSPETPES